MIPLFTWGANDEPSWWRAKPDIERYRKLRDEMDERKIYGDFTEPPQHGGGWDDMPSVISALLKFGLVPGLLLWLIVIGATEVRFSLRTMEENGQKTSAAQERIERTQQSILRVLIAGCVNGAKTPLERSECLKAGL